MCVYTDNSSFPQFAWDKILNSVQNWWKRYLILNTVKNLLLFCNSVFWMCDFHRHVSCSYFLVHNLRCWQWCRLIMRSGLWHCMVWCLVMDVLEEHSSCIYAGHQKQYVLNENFVTTNQITESITWNTTIMNLNTPHFLWSVSLFITNQIHTCIRQ